MKSIIGARKTEYSVLTGEMYSIEDAFAIGLVDDIAYDMREAESKVLSYLQKVNSCGGNGRSKCNLTYREIC